MLPTGAEVRARVNTVLALLSAHIDVFANAYKIIPTQTPTIVFTFVFAKPCAKIKRRSGRVRNYPAGSTSGVELKT